MPRPSLHKLILLAGFAITALVYWPGLHGSWLFDDYPNIVENAGVQPHHASVASLVGAALSSPSSEFKRPLSSLSFAANYLASGLDPFGWKLTNLVIHLLNGLLVFLLARRLLLAADQTRPASDATSGNPTGEATGSNRSDVLAALIAAGWMLLPINLTGVLYVVQRMESLANLFVLAGLLGYVSGRQRMLRQARGGFAFASISVIVATGVGALAKETAVMLPLYTAMIEWTLFGARFASGDTARIDKRILSLFAATLVIPLIAGLAWQLPQVLSHGDWATRDFTLGTRLLSETRIVLDYIRWTLLPTPQALSFYHDNFSVSTGLLSPWTTLASLVGLIALAALALGLRRRLPLASLGIALFLGCHLLTGTILPLELVYEHRNYFASFGLLLAVVPLLAVPMTHFMALPRRVLLGGMLLLWTTQTAITASSWGNPLLLAETLAARAPDSPRAEYELGRTYIIYSHYDPASPFTKLAYAPLERAAALPNASILPEQALIFMNSRMHMPIKNAWWDSLISKLKARRPGVQDESALGALSVCAQDHECNLPEGRMLAAYLAALSHPAPSARLLAMYGDYAWNVLGDRTLGIRMTQEAVHASPYESAYRITLIRMFIATDDSSAAEPQLHALQHLNIGGRLSSTIDNLRRQMRSSVSSATSATK